MAVNWNAGLMRWKPYTDATGRAYPLNHLHPFRYDVQLPPKDGNPGPVVTVHVGFAMHCFTRDSTPEDSADTVYQDDRESRTFCPVRYELSSQLPHIAQTLMARPCAFARDENYVTVDVQRPSPDALGVVTVRYAVFFNLKRQRVEGKDVVLVVFQSAYPLDNDKADPSHGKIGFTTLLVHALRGTKPKPPPKRRR